MFNQIHASHFLHQQGQDFLWQAQDSLGQTGTLLGSVLSNEITRVLLIRGTRPATRRYQLASGTGGTLPYHSWMVDKGDEDWPVPEGEPERVRLEHLLTGFAVSETALRLISPLPEHIHVYGLGERTGTTDKRGQAFPLWNVDPPMHHNAQTATMYVSIPFYLCLDTRTGLTQGMLVDHTGSMNIDLGQEQPGSAYFTIEGDILPVYFFAGPTPADVLRQYTELTGRMPLPPRWTLGHHQCRWSYESAEEARQIAHTLRTRKHPCDAIWLDIDYMDGFRNFTWHPENFPAPAALAEELHRQGLRLVTILDPGTKYEETYPIYREGNDGNHFCRYPNGDYFLGSVWPGSCVFPDFSRQATRSWWGKLYAGLLEVGVDGIWNDMNEPALTNILSEQSSEHIHGKTMDSDVIQQAGGKESIGQDGETSTHRLFHNAYGLEMARATYEGLRSLQPETRPFVLSRSGTGGIQRYAAVWTGDNTSTWDHIPLAITMSLNLSMSGVPFIGMDIGGFWQDSTGELLVRFAQLGACMPFCRNHSAKYTRRQEPWAFGEPYESAYRSAIELRYRCLPYLYTLFAESARTGAPIIRPLYYHYPQDEQACQAEHAFLLGENLLSAPICEEGAVSRKVYLPPGIWFDYWTGQAYQGEQINEIAAPLERWPLLVRANSILTMGPLMQYTTERPTDPLTISCYLTDRGQASYTLYEDDGETPAYTHGAFAETFITCQAKQASVTVQIEERFTNYRPQRKWYEIVVYLNGRTLNRRVKAGKGRVSLRLQ